MIDPIWIANQSYQEWYKSIEIYEDYIYAAGYSYNNENETYSAIIGKYDLNAGSQIWMRNWSTHHPDTLTRSIDVYDDAIYIVGETGKMGFIITWIDAFICKFDLDGNLIWSKIVNESKFDHISSVKGYDNYLYLCGDICCNKGSDSWILKYDTNGNKIWGKTYSIPFTSYSHLYDLEIYNGYIYAEGQSKKDKTGQDLFVVKVSLDGELIWNRDWGGEGAQLGALMDMGDDGFIYIAGYGSKEGIHINDFIWKFDINGNLKWVATTSLTSGLIDVVFWNGDVYGIGEDRTFYRDTLLAKFDDQGNLIWYLTYKSEDPGSYADGFTMDEYEDYFYLVGSNMGAGFIMKYDVTLYSDNNKPDTPSKPSGETNGVVNQLYTYSSATADPDGDLISYSFSWDDGNQTIVEWFNSGETISASYSWSERGKYKVRVRARDECGFVSAWSEPLEVTMPRNRAINKPFLNFLESHLNLFPIMRYLLRL